MPGLLDFLFQQQQPQAATDDIGMMAPPQASGGGLFGQAFGGDYDLGSRLMMAGAFLDDNSGAAMQMAQQMERRKIAKDVAKRRYEAAREILSKRKDLVPLYNADPDQFMDYYMKMTFDEQVTQKAAEREQQQHVRNRAEKLQDDISQWAHQDQSQLQGHKYKLEEDDATLDRQKLFEQYKQGLDPNFRAKQGLMAAIADRASKIQAPGAGIRYNAPDVSTLAARQVLGDPNLSQFESSQLMMGEKPSPAIDDIVKNRNAAMSAPMREFLQMQGMDPTLTPEKYMSLKGSGAGGGKITEQGIKASVLAASAVPAVGLTLDDFKKMKEYGTALYAKHMDIPFIDIIAHGQLPDDVQVAEQTLNNIMQLHSYAVSGQSQNSQEMNLKRQLAYSMPNDGPEMVKKRYDTYRAWVNAIKTQAQLGVNAKDGKPLPPEFYSMLNSLGGIQALDDKAGSLQSDDQKIIDDAMERARKRRAGQQ